MITTDRDVLAGFHTTDQVKEGIRQEARRDQISMSLLLHRLAVQFLQNRGHKVKDEDK